MRNLGVCGLLLSIWGALACSTFPGGSGESKTTREPSASDVATYPAGGNGHRPSSGGKSALQAADTAAPATLDLESVIRRAASENPAVKSAWHRWKASTQKRAQEVSLPDPRVEGTIFNPKDTEKWMMGLNQEIPWPG
ncbi:hypothetical protein HYR69_07160, partial [Candidatus Sumerlaeota bacterium]|nr:hypothetical protein [Candidatus Sumerlaeota bacterium]